MIATRLQIVRLTWDRFERACLLLGIDAEGVFFSGPPSGEMSGVSLECGAALVALLSDEPVDTGALRPGDLAEQVALVVHGLFDAVVEAQKEAQRYRKDLEKRYPYLFKQTVEDNGPPMRVVLSKFSPSDYAEVTQRWTLTEIYLWLLALKVQQFDDTIRSAVADFRQTMTN